MLFYLLLLAILSFNDATMEESHTRIARQAAAACITPDNKPGGCIKLTSCDVLIALLLNSAKDSGAQSFLRRSQCARFKRGESPMVCCPKPTPQSRNVPYKGECGKSVNFKTRVIGGRNAELGTWPWMAALGYRIKGKKDYNFNCGGSLISSQWVLTAAHCVKFLPSNLELGLVRIGDLDLNETVSDNAAAVNVQIQNIIPHPQYSRSPYVNDIALIRLNEPVKLTNHVRPICLLNGAQYKTDEYYRKKKPFIIGWGRTQLRGISTTTWLQEATISMVNNTKCAQDYLHERLSKIDERVICAAESGKDTCQGDSGGPLIFPNPKDKTYYIGGIVSYGIGCASDKYPGVYTRVAAFTDWISETTGIKF